jgi:hypothetical protein
MATNQSLSTIQLQLQLLTKNVIDLQSNYGLGFRLALLLSQMCTTTPLSSTPKKVLAMMGNEFCWWLRRVFLLALLSLMGN